MTTEKPTDKPPYLAFSRFEGFLSSLKGKALPPRFDRTLVQRMSGAEQSQLGLALRFFKLIEGEDRRFTDRMRRLIEAHGTEAWAGAIRELVTDAYRGIVGDLDSAATMGQLTDAFRERGDLGGSALAKAIRFYLTGARAAGIELSPHYTAPAVPSGTGNGDQQRPSRQRRKRSRETGGDMPQTPEAPQGSRQLKYSLPSGDVQVWLPARVTQKELDALAKYLREYVTLMGDDQAQ
jgi:hypothetical protein